MSATSTPAPAYAPQPPEPAGPARHPRRWLILAIVLVAELMDLIDGTIVNVAAPSIRRDLGGGQTALQWFGASYTLAFAVLLITGARLGDMLGRRRVFVAGVIGFTLASIGCAAAPSSETLIALRVLQGAFGALLIPQGFGVIKEVFAEDEIQKAFTAFGPVIGIAAVASPIIGGALTSGNLWGLGWRAVFLVNVPVGLAGLVGALWIMPRTRAKPGTRLDPGGAVLVSAASFAVVYPLVQGRELGWPGWIFGLLALGLVGFVAFARYERRHADRALITPSLLRNRAFTSGIVVCVCFFAAMIGLNLLLSVFCQVAQGFSPLRTGLTLAPFAVGVAITAGPSYPLAQRFGRASMQLGLAVMAAGLVVLAVMAGGAGAHVGTWSLVPGELLAGMGMGLSLPPLFDFILAGVREHEVGSASGVLNAAQQFAGALGIAVFATIFFAYVDGGRAASASVRDTVLLAVIPLGLAFLGVFRLPRKARDGVTA